MDPITSAIMAALTAGAVAGLTDTTKRTIIDLYDSLKSKIEQKHGKDSKVAKAISDLESEPNFESYQTGLQKRISDSKIDQDVELQILAKNIISLLDSSRISQTTHNTQNVFGDNNAVAGPGGKASVTIQPKSSKKKSS